MKNLLCLFFCLISVFANGQVDLIGKYGGKYIYNMQLYTRKEIKDIVKHNEEAFNVYQSGIGYYKDARYIARGGLGIALVGVVLASRPGEREKLIRTCTTGCTVTLIGLFISVIAVIPRLNGDNQIEQSIEIFNSDIKSQYSYVSNVSLSIGPTKNGLGLVLDF